MSYILEALRRADAERQRGAVPGLHAQASGGVSADRAAPARIGPLALAGAAVVMVAAGASGAWWWAQQRPGAVGPAPITTSAATPVAAPVAVPIPAAIATPPASPAPPAVLPVAAPPPPPQSLPVAPIAALPAPALQVPAAPRARAAGPAAAPAALPASRRSAAAPGAEAAPASAPPARLPLLAELPEALRREMAGLNINGSVYAEQPAARIVILNGQVFREGDSPANELRIEQIRPRSVVFNLRGQRFEMPI